MTANAGRSLAGLAARRGAAGAQYLVVRGGRVELEICHGLADTAHARPVSPATTFNAYSITKTFTAAAVLALASAGRLELDDPIGVAAGFPGLEAYGSVRQTLLHRAGFRNPNPLRWFHLAEQHKSFDEAGFVMEQIRSLRGSRRRLARSGYSNVGYLLLGLAIERAWNGPFVKAVQTLVIDPVEARDDEVMSFEIESADHHARGHLRRLGLLDLMLGALVERSTIVEGIDERWVRLRLHYVNGSAYGGLMANARGLARMGQAVLGTVAGLASAVRQQLLSVAPGAGPPRSLGWFSGQVGRHRWFAHAGGGLGAYCELRLYPEADAVSVLMTNAPGFSDARCLDLLDAPWRD